MRTWRRLAQQTFCGGLCRRLLNIGDPVLVVTIAGVKRPLIRCEHCEGPAPPDLPLTVVRAAPVDASWTPMTQLAKRPAVDWKAKQAGS